MSGAPKRDLVSIPDYLAGELTSPTRHEYVGGVVHAMAVATNVHNLIASNTLAALWSRLRGSNCRAYNSDTKIRIRLPLQTRFYYPDASVICRSNAPTDTFQDEPAVVVEVASPETRRVDAGEKRDAYTMIPSLSVYVLAEQDAATVTVFRRTEQGFVAEVHEGAASVVPLPEIGVLPLTEMYDGVAFGAA